MSSIRSRLAWQPAVMAAGCNAAGRQLVLAGVPAWRHLHRTLGLQPERGTMSAALFVSLHTSFLGLQLPSFLGPH